MEKDRGIVKAFLYGSEESGSNKAKFFWKAAGEKGFKVKIFDLSPDGSEKEVDTAMTADIVELAGDTFYTGKANVVTFIIVTGDRDLRPSIEKVLDRRIHVELWSWKHNMSKAYWDLHKKEELFTANILDTYLLDCAAVDRTPEKVEVDRTPEKEGSSSPNPREGSSQPNRREGRQQFTEEKEAVDRTPEKAAPRPNWQRQQCQLENSIK